MPAHVKPIPNWGVAFARPDDGVVLVSGQVQLMNGTRAEWLAQFEGDEAALTLALKQVSGQVQPNSRAHTLRAQTERHLARIVQERRDRDRRYRQASEANRPRGVPQSPGKRTLADALRDAEARERAVA